MANKKQTKSPKMVGYIQALKNFWHGYTDFSGTSTRAEYWWVVLTGLIAMSACGFVAGMLSVFSAIFSFIWIGVVGICGVLLVLPAIALKVRRIHDVGMSAWVYYAPFLIVAAIQLLGFIMLLGFELERAGAIVYTIGDILSYGVSGLGLVLTLLPSKIKDNKYRTKK